MQYAEGNSGASAVFTACNEITMPKSIGAMRQGEGLFLKRPLRFSEHVIVAIEPASTEVTVIFGPPDFKMTTSPTLKLSDISNFRSRCQVVGLGGFSVARVRRNLAEAAMA
ncbi:hypothetical protein [Mesorhizobium sp. KR1-2]|uniref:hypothetical protein n=1 Tax=Mesorhizobium sp. KR1-2 TaxID=3156609 RepID=UPI0032B4873D